MGASGTDVAREAADLVLLDDHFGTIVAAVELGRSTFANIRRFLTYHLTDNVAELTPFVVWALSGGSIPLAITVLQVLALDIGTDLLPALALGTERPQPRTMLGRRRLGSLIDRAVVTRAFGVLGPAEAVLGNRLLLYAVAIEAITMLVFVGVPPFPGLLGARFQPTRGGCLPALTGPRRARRRHAPEGRPRPPVARRGHEGRRTRRHRPRRQRCVRGITGRRRTRRHPLELKCRLRTKHDEMFLAYEAHPFYRR